MAISFITGFEWNSLQQGALDGSGGSGASVDGTIKRTGAYSLKIVLADSSTASCSVSLGSTGGKVRFYVRVTSNGLTAARGLFGAQATNLQASLRLNPNGTIGYYDNTTLVGTSTTALTDTSKWYCIEATAGTVSSGTLLKIDNNVEVTGSISSLGWTGTIGENRSFADGAYTLYVDDFVQDDTNWPGPGAVVLLRGVVDNSRGAWTAGAGGVSNLWDAINNLPPAGVASANETDTSNIESASKSGTDAYIVELQTYTVGGVPSSSTINGLRLHIASGEDINTGTKTGTYEQTQNPVIAAQSFNFGADAGAHGVYASNWLLSAFNVTAPTVTLGTAPLVKIIKTDTTTRTGCVCLVGLYVDYTPPSGTPQSASDSATASETVTPAPTVSPAESVAATDTPAIAADLPATDSATATDSISVTLPPVPISATDSATATDTPAPQGQPVIAESAATTESTALSADLPIADSSTATDSVSIDAGSTPKSATDSAAATDAHTLSAQIDPADSATATEAIALDATRPITESATGSDTPLVTAALAGTDSGTVTDVPSITGQIAPAESAAATEATTLSATVPATDSATASDGVSIDTGSGIIPVSASDSATATDTVSPQALQVAADSAAETDTFSFNAALPLSDSGAGSEIVAVEGGFLFTDAATASEAIFVSVLVNVSETAETVETWSLSAALAAADAIAEAESIVAGEAQEANDLFTANETISIISVAVKARWVSLHPRDFGRTLNERGITLSVRERINRTVDTNLE